MTIVYLRMYLWCLSANYAQVALRGKGQLSGIQFVLLLCFNVENNNIVTIEQMSPCE